MPERPRSSHFFPSLGRQQAVYRCGTDREQFLPGNNIQHDLPVLLQYRNDFRQDRRQPLAADAVHDRPYLFQTIQYRLIVQPMSCAFYLLAQIPN